jgi:hypothetical protein
LLMRCAIDTVYQLSTCGEGIRLIIESGKVLRCIINMLKNKQPPVPQVPLQQEGGTTRPSVITVTAEDDPHIIHMCLAILYNVSSSGEGHNEGKEGKDNMIETLISRASSAAAQTQDTNALCAALLCTWLCFSARVWLYSCCNSFGIDHINEEPRIT